MTTQFRHRGVQNVRLVTAAQISSQLIGACCLPLALGPTVENVFDTRRMLVQIKQLSMFFCTTIMKLEHIQYQVAIDGGVNVGFTINERKERKKREEKKKEMNPLCVGILRKRTEVGGLWVENESLPTRDRRSSQV